MFKNTLAMILVVLLGAPALAGEGTDFPAQFDLRYILHRQGLDLAEVHWRLEPLKNQGFRYSSSSHTIGIAKVFRDEQIDEISDWRFRAGRLQSLRYRYARSGGKRQRRAEARFDWDRDLIHNSLNGKSWTIPLPAATYDKLNYLLALMHDLGRGLRPAQYRVADGVKLKTYSLRYLREERIDTAIGPLDCLVLERTVEGDDRLTRVWVAKSLHYLPVKIEHHEEGEVVRLSLNELKSLDGYPAAD